MTEAKAPRNSKLKPCACSMYHAIETIDGDERVYGTACNRVTHNKFAQGHDAKLVSFLVKAELSGDKIYWNSGDTDQLMPDAQAAAAVQSPELAAKAERALVNALDRLAASGKLRNGKTQPKPPREVAVQVVTETPAADAPVRIKTRGKVGRWEYDGEVDEDATFWYETKSGTQAAAAGKWTPIQS